MTRDTFQAILTTFNRGWLRRNPRDPLAVRKQKLLEWLESAEEAGTPLGAILRQLDDRAHRIGPHDRAPAAQTHLSPEVVRAAIEWERFVAHRRVLLADVMHRRNLHAARLERNEDIHEAVRLYELNVRDEFDGSLPYDRLLALYLRYGQRHKAVRVCEAYLRLQTFSNGQGAAGAEEAARFQEQLDRLRGTQAGAA